MQSIRRNPHEVRAVITGIGTINPIGNNVPEFWDNLAIGKSGVRTSQNVDLTDYHVQIAGEIDMPDVTEYFTMKKMAKRLDRYIVFGHVAGTQALRDSGLEIDAAPHRYGTLIGTGDGGVGAHHDAGTKIATRGMNAVSPMYIINCIPNTASGFFAQTWNLQGPSFSVSSACATTNHAIGTAIMMIKMGMVDAVFAGGAEAAVNQNGIASFGNIMALSERNDSPETASRPFDIDRDGFVLAEGAGVLCVEELEHAKKRGAHIYCEVTGFGFSCDAHDLVAPHPEARGATSAMRQAVEMSGIEPSEIDLINAHGTSTPLGDPAEYRAVENVFKDHAKRVAVHSTKSMTGHLLGATGAVEAIATIMAFERDLIHESINVFTQDPEILFDVVTGGPREKKIRHALSNGFGFGGQNSVIIMSRFEG